MANTKQIGQGLKLELDEANGSSYTQVTLVAGITPPGRERVQTQALALEDLLDVPVPAYEAQSDMSFVIYWTPGDTDHERLLALFDSKAEAAWRLVYPHEEPATFNPTQEFSGRVTNFEPVDIENATVVAATLTITRSTPITPNSTTITAAAVNEPPLY